MTQRGVIFLGSTEIAIHLPSPSAEVLPGIFWGGIDAFPSPAYWAYQVLARRIEGKTVNYRLGHSLKEEVGACLLGGHGIPSGVGLAAFAKLKAKGAFSENVPSEDQLFAWLSEPLTIDGRQVRYRFAKQKSKYLAASLRALAISAAPVGSGRDLRDWLLAMPGIGYKTASWVARNWLDADDVAILDIHVLRAGMLGGFFQSELTVERNYLELESQFLRFSEGLGVRASELDAVIWLEMMSSGATVHRILGRRDDQSVRKARASIHRANQSHPNTSQMPLLI